MGWVWVLIPLTAILMGGFQQWLRFKQTQQKLGTSTHELEEEMAALRSAAAASEAERTALVRRVQNLEAIVTSQVWDVVHDGALPPAEKQQAVAAAQARLSLPEEETDANRAERLARRLRT